MKLILKRRNVYQCAVRTNNKEIIYGIEMINDNRFVVLFKWHFNVY
jgi:hypothetical protein